MKRRYILGGLAVVTGGLGYLAYRLWGGKKPGQKRPPAKFDPTPNYNPSALPINVSMPPTARPIRSSLKPDTVFPLRRNSAGTKVALLQKFLNQQHNSKLSTDGIWGPATDKAMKDNGHPNQLSREAFHVIEFTMKQLGLAGQSPTTNHII